MANQDQGNDGSVVGSLLTFLIPLGLFGGGLALLYAVAVAFSSPAPYPQLSKIPPASAPTPAAAPAAPSTPAAKATPTPEKAPAEPTEPAVASAEAGEGLYNIYCVACHQAEGLGKVGFAPYIRNHDFLATSDDDFLRKTIVSGRPGTSMVGWAHLKPHEIDSLILYLRANEDPDAPVTVKIDHSRKHPGDPEPGRDLYAQYCATCHGQNAAGYSEGGPGPAIGNAGFLAVASDDYIFQTIKHGRAGTAMRPFSGPTGLANLSDPEIADIIAFLRQNNHEVPEIAKSTPDPGAGELHFQANCAACHQKDGHGLPGFAPSIRNRDFLAIADDKFIKDSIHKGRPGTSMVQRPDLSDQVVADIIAFLRANPTENPIDIKVDHTLDLASKGSAEAGLTKYGLYCASCHGPEGKGYVSGGAGPAIGLAGFLDAASDDYIYQTLKLGRMGTAMRPFIGATGLANLNDQDANDIIAYLRSLNNTASN